MKEKKFLIVWKHIQNKGEEFDEEDNFCGNKTLTTIETDEVIESNIKKAIESICEIPADYGDGVTNSKILVIYDKETKESYPIDYFN